MFFVFDKTGVYVKDNYTNTTLLLRRKVKGLYRVDPQTTEAFLIERH